jgi:predicted acylesterase/phospholipase RssA
MAGTAIVLSGGGSKGDFEVGALQYVYGKGIRPNLLCSTSVGSVNALKLAEGETGPARGLDGLTQMWLSMTTPSDFFAEAGWLLDHRTPIRWFRQYLLDFAAANPATAEDGLTVSAPLLQLRLAELDAVTARREAIGIDRAVAGAETLAVLALGSSLLLPAPVGGLAAAGLGGALALSVSSIAEALAAGLASTSFLTLGPLEALARQHIDKQAIADWAAAGGRLRMAAVALESGELRYVTETGLVVGRDGTPVPGPATRAPECRPLAGLLEERVDDVAAAQADLAGGRQNRDSSAELLKKIAERDAAQAALDACQAAHPAPPAEMVVDLVQGMLASASIPTFFPPQQLGSEHYVDGGVRAVLPSEAALREDVDRIIAVHASKRGVDPMVGTNLNLYSIALRSLMELAIDEIAVRDAHPVMGFGNRDVTVIQPRVDVHSIYSMYPAFVRSRMAYGWMCAADELDPLPDAGAAARARAIADRISVLRYGAARLECWATGHPVPPTMVVLSRPSGNDRIAVASALSAMKVEIHSLVDERRALGAAMPAGQADWDDPNRWWFGFETHPWAANRSDAAEFVKQEVPLSLAVGASSTVSLTVLNTGTTTWEPAAGYLLGSQDPQDNTVWGTGRVPLTTTVHPGSTATFTFVIQAPATAGTRSFSWQMLQEGVRWFGEASDPATIAVTPVGEPAACGALRTTITTIDQRVERLEALLLDDPQHDAPLNKQITALRAEREATIAAMQRAGCLV